MSSNTTSSLSCMTAGTMVHTCGLCNMQNIVQGEIFDDEGEENYFHGTCYQSSMVLDGALNGCAFFKCLLSSLAPILVANGYEQGYTSHGFHPQNWIFALDVLRGDEVYGHWLCAQNELSDCARYIDQYTEHELKKHIKKWFELELPGRDGGDTSQLVAGLRCPEQAHSTYIILAFQDDPAGVYNPLRPFMHEYTKAESVSWAKKHLWDCENSHEFCRKLNHSFLPSRLLHIELTSDGIEICVRIHRTTPCDSNGTPQRYAALSYCWGGPQCLQLNVGSEDTLTRGFALSLLPKTIRDAVQATWNLGIQWLWVDSLCIMQDNQKEKAIEMAQMHLIYENAFVTLSATRASRCSQGFLHQVSFPFPGSVGFKLPFATPSGEIGSVIVLQHSLEWESYFPIDKRGWTLQEHFLARRMLRFTDFKLHWSCKTLSAFELEDQETVPFSPLQGLELHNEIYKSLHDNQNRDYTHWMSIIEKYTKRELSNNLDTLPAMSGIAQCWARKGQDQYLAGIWKSHLPLGLLWYRLQPSQKVNSEVYLGPSWSWASAHQASSFGKWLMSGKVSSIKIISCNINLVHSQVPYGAVRSGFLKLRGLLRQVVLDDSRSDCQSIESEANNLNRRLANMPPELGSTYLDFSGAALVSVVRGCRIFCLEICGFDPSSEHGPSGLVLVQDGKEFRRIGVFCHVGRPCNHPDEGKARDEKARAFRNIALQEITII